MAIMFLLVLSACSTMRTFSVSERTRVAGNDYQSVFNGIVKYCTEQGFSLKQADRVSGIIETDMKTSGHTRSKLTFNVSSVNPKITQIVLLISFQNESSGGLWTQAGFSEQEAREQYAQTFSEIEKYIVK